MPKNKTSLYLLFPLVIVIWGLIIYKVSGAFVDETVAIPAVVPKAAEEVKRVKKDTFSLLPLERDPFLGHYYKNPVEPKKHLAAPPRDVQWPEISYLGLISETGKSSGVHILQVNGKQFLLEKGGAAEEIKIVGSRPGQVTLLYQGDKRTFSKANGS